MASDDPQHDALFAAENEFYPKRARRTNYMGAFSLELGNKLIAEVRSLYGLPRISLRYLHQPRSTAGAYVEFYSDGAAVITFTGVNPLCAHTLLHELAHVVCEVYFDGAEDHGPEFVGIMMWLFDYFQIIPADAFSLILRRHGVRRRPPKYCSPEALGKMRAKKG